MQTLNIIFNTWFTVYMFLVLILDSLIDLNRALKYAIVMVVVAYNRDFEVLHTHQYR